MNSHPRTTRYLSFPASLLLLIPLLFAAFPGGAASANREKQYHTTFATINYTDEDKFYRFTRNIGSGLKFLGENPRKNPRLAAKRVDAIVMRVMEILDMRMANLHFNVAILPDHEITRTYAVLSSGKSTALAYYDHGTRTIAVSAEQIDDRVLAHEIAHAVICAWSSSPPPSSAQEILANFAEQHLDE
jgi:hypothetical protein